MTFNRPAGPGTVGGALAVHEPRLRPLEAADATAFVAAARRSRGLHRPWLTAPCTEDAFNAHLARFQAPTSFAFVAVLGDEQDLVAALYVTNIVYGSFRSGYLSHCAFAPHQGHGLMQQALRQLVRSAFGPMKLHRLEANIQPENSASVALVRRCGFSREGYSPRYLKIGGRWRDHERWALVRPSR